MDSATRGEPQKPTEEAQEGQRSVTLPISTLFVGRAQTLVSVQRLPLLSANGARRCTLILHSSHLNLVPSPPFQRATSGTPPVPISTSRGIYSFTLSLTGPKHTSSLYRIGPNSCSSLNSTPSTSNVQHTFSWTAPPSQRLR